LPFWIFEIKLIAFAIPGASASSLSVLTKPDFGRVFLSERHSVYESFNDVRGGLPTVCQASAQLEE
jgi:hypothetical protein